MRAVAICGRRPSTSLTYLCPSPQMAFCGRLREGCPGLMYLLISHANVNGVPCLVLSPEGMLPLCRL